MGRYQRHPGNISTFPLPTRRAPFSFRTVLKKTSPSACAPSSRGRFPHLSRRVREFGVAHVLVTTSPDPAAPASARCRLSRTSTRRRSATSSALRQRTCVVPPARRTSELRREEDGRRVPDGRQGDHGVRGTARAPARPR